MSAAATAAGYLYASGRLRGIKQHKEQRAAERAAEKLRQDREGSSAGQGPGEGERATPAPAAGADGISTAPTGAKKET